MANRWISFLLIMLVEHFAARRCAQIQFMKLQIELLRAVFVFAKPHFSHPASLGTDGSVLGTANQATVDSPVAWTWRPRQG